jgi:hypothetical protein
MHNFGGLTSKEVATWVTKKDIEDDIDLIWNDKDLSIVCLQY